jgi:hypothetical protein
MLEHADLSAASWSVPQVPVEALGRP